MPDDGRLANRDVKVGGLQLNHGGEQFVDDDGVGHNSDPRSLAARLDDSSNSAFHQRLRVEIKKKWAEDLDAELSVQVMAVPNKFSCVLQLRRISQLVAIANRFTAEILMDD
jgi:hypothetical protein